MEPLVIEMAVLGIDRNTAVITHTLMTVAQCIEQ